jgi:hypothetical protein
MSSDYEVLITDPYGTVLLALGAQSFTGLELAYSVNDVGGLSLILPGTYDISLFKKDGRIAVYRSVAGRSPSLEGERIWLIRGITRSRDEEGRKTIKLIARDTNDLLNRRYVAYDAGTSQATKTGTADNIMKAIIRENYTASALTSTRDGYSASDTSPDISSYLTVQADLSAAASTPKAFARRKVLTVLQELAQASYTGTIYCAFDIVATSLSALEFRTYTGQRGMDHSSDSLDPVLIGPDMRNVGASERADDWSEEISFAIAAGQGTGTDRVVMTAADTARIAESPFGRIEGLTDTRNTDIANTTAVQAEANALLRAGRGRRTFTASILDTPGATYGLHYGYGDIVAAVVDGDTLDCRIDTVHIGVQDGQETLDLRLRSET